MEGITLVMMETSNRFEDIMKMPYACYLSIIKNIRMKELMSIPEWRKQYLEQKYKVSLRENKIDKSKHKTKCDISGLHALAGSL